VTEPVIHEHDIVLVRHGATEWSENGRHTSHTELPLLPEGERDATSLRDRLSGIHFALVLVSPRQRAMETCVLAGLGDRREVDPDLAEWDYGDFEGITTPAIRDELGDPEWTVWTGPIVNGETVEEVGARVDRVIARAQRADGPVALFGHGHSLRILTARWLGLPPVGGRLFALHTGTLGVLGFERDTHVLQHWNT
jgi:probable phosphoglycerate mutase